MEGVRPQQPGIRLFLGLPGRLHRQLLALLLLGRSEPARPLAQRRGDSRRREVLRRRDAARSRRVHPAGRRRPALLPLLGRQYTPLSVAAGEEMAGPLRRPARPAAHVRGLRLHVRRLPGPAARIPARTGAGREHPRHPPVGQRPPRSAPSAEAVTAATTGAASSRSSRAASACRPSSPGPDICRRARRATRRP